jgi:hypothetical protein
MKNSFLAFFAIVSTFILLIACSRDEQSGKPFRNDAIVKKPISKPVGERLQPDSGPAVEKDRTQSVSNPMQTGAVEKSGSGAILAESDRRRVKPGDGAGPSDDAGHSQPGAVPRDPSGSSVVAPGSGGSKGLYLVNRGETLAEVSGKREVHGDRLKWPVLYRLNSESLASLPAADNLPDLPLRDGMKLRTVTAEEKTTNLEKRSGSVWVVNVLSAKTNAEAIPAVISLIRNGYTVYLVNARVNEKDWIRVRVGFFKTKEEAESEGKKIMEMMSFPDSWVTRLGRTEFTEFAGF